MDGTGGLVRWEFRRSDEPYVSSGADYTNQPTITSFSDLFRSGYHSFQLGAGIPMSYDDTKVIEPYGFMRAISGEDVDGPTIVDVVAIARTLDVIFVLARDHAWVTIDQS